MTANSTELERENMNQLVEDLESMMPFEPIPTPEPPTGGTISTMKNGVIEIKWLDGTSYNVSETPNAPVTKSISNGKMELVKFDSESKTWVTGNEYSYVQGKGSSDNNSSKWANARVTINDVDSYFVWIPRYAYRIIYFKDAESKKAYQEGALTEEDAVANGQIIGYSDSRGIVDEQGRKIDGVASTTKTMVSKDYFMVHPAFINDVDAGGWTEELEGIWVGKYEAARSDTQGTTQGSATTLKVQSGVTSFRTVSIGDIYTYSQNYESNLQSHMLKNSEWGAVAYLTESKYGRNGTEVTSNDNSSYYTGGGSGTAYITNVSQSSTGNVYGIYDFSGGTNEYVAGYLKTGGSLNYGSIFADGTSDKYSTAYNGTDVKTAYKYGDATYETSGWHSDAANFLYSRFHFFKRGGLTGGSSSGVFYYGAFDGSYNYAHSFRLALVV